MVQKVLIKRTSTNNSPPADGSLSPGELAIEMGTPTRLWVGVPTVTDPSGKKQLTPSGGVTVADVAPLNPAQGDLWWESDTAILWIWYVDADSSQWVQVSSSGGGGGAVTIADAAPATPVQGDLWWESDTGILWIWFDDGTSAQWVQAAGSASVAPAGDFVLKTGDTMSGQLNIVYPNPVFHLAKGASGQTSMIVGSGPVGNRWAIHLGDYTPEGGANSGSDFTLGRFDDIGTSLGAPLTISRSTGDTTLTGSVICKVTEKDGFNADITSLLAHSAYVAKTSAPAIWYHFFQCAGVTTGTISTDGASTAYNTTSDASLKEDLKSFDAGNIIDNTYVYDFAWRTTGERAYGVIAQEAVEVYPQAVTHQLQPDKDEWWGVDYSKYVPVILQELKRLRERVADLEGRVTVDPKRG